MIKAILIDDQQGSRQLLAKHLESFSDVELLGQATGVEAGYLLIQEKNPELVFLDVEMQDGTGFDLLGKFASWDFHVIFTTGHEKYALKALKMNAVDYLLKPVDRSDLAEAITKVLLKQPSEQEQVAIKSLLTSQQSASAQQDKLVLKDIDSIYILPINELIYLHADANYTNFHTITQGKIVISKTLKEYVELLEDHGFYRCHHSYLVNLQHCRRFNKKESTVELINENSVPVSTRRKEELLDRLKAFV